MRSLHSQLEKKMLPKQLPLRCDIENAHKISQVVIAKHNDVIVFCDIAWTQHVSYMLQPRELK